VVVVVEELVVLVALVAQEHLGKDMLAEPLHHDQEIQI
jgi:hypothetical protein